MKIYGITKSKKKNIDIRSLISTYVLISICVWSAIATIMIIFDNIYILSMWDVIGFITFSVLSCIGYYYMVYRCESVSGIGYFYGGLLLCIYNLIILEFLYYIIDIALTEDSVFMLFFPYALLLFFIIYILLRRLHLLLWKYEPIIVTRRYSEPIDLKFLLNGLFTLVLFVGTGILSILLALWRLDFLGL